MAVTLTRPFFPALFFSERFHFRFAIACVVGMFAGLVLSRGVLSVSMISMVVNGLIYWIGAAQRNEKVWSWANGLVGLFFIVYLLSGIWSEDKGYWLERLQVKLPFLLLPIGFLPLKKMNQEILHRLVCLFAIAMVLSAAFVLVNYMFNSESVSYSAGQVMKTPYSHVRFSLMIAFAAFASFHLFVEKFQWLTAFDRWIMLGVGILLTVFLHVLAVRSGLVAFYITVVVLAFRHAFVNGKWISGISFAIGFMMLPLLAYLFIPTFNEKVGYMRYTLNEMVSGKDVTTLSDGQRLTSIQKSWDIFKHNALVGVGTGDLPKATEQAYNDDTIQALRMPHNQWVWCLASVGIIGTLIIALSLFFPLYQMRHALNILTVSFFAVIHTSLLTEATLEEQVGTAFYLVFLLLFVSVYTKHVKSLSTQASREQRQASYN